MLSRIPLTLALGLALAGSAAADDSPKFDWNIWRGIVVQEGGRFKPLDTLAWETMTKIAGRASVRAESFFLFSAGDVQDWSALAAKLSKDNSGNAVLAKLSASLPKDLLASIEKSSLDSAALFGKLTAAEKNVEQYRRKVALNADRDVESVARLKAYLEDTNDEAGLKLLRDHADLEREYRQIESLKARLLVEINKALSSGAVAEAAGVATGEQSAPAQALATRRAVEFALGEVVAPLPAEVESFAGAIEARKYNATELYVRWLLTWQGWDTITSMKEVLADVGRDDEVYWRYQKADAWDRLPMIDARHKEVSWLLKPESLTAASPWAIASNRAFEKTALEAHAKRGADIDLSPGENHALSAFDAHRAYAQIRMGFQLQVGPSSAESTGNRMEAPADRWLPLIFLLYDNDPLAAQPYATVDLAALREGFAAARAGLKANDAAMFNEGSKKFADAFKRLGAVSDGYADAAATIDTELLYNRTQPFLLTLVVAVMASVCLVVSLGVDSAIPYRVGYTLLILAESIMTGGMALRIMIAGRPPVTNMFETIIWAVFVAVALAVVLGFVYRHRVIPTTAAVLLSLSTLLAHNMPIAMGATIDPLQPVLRSNYWLTVHVMTIVASYGAFMLTWGLGNAGLFSVLMGKETPRMMKDLSTFCYRAMQVGVLLLASGTLLGGWWAAESWGRFWGWDPKETWALIALIVYLMILHARKAGLVGMYGTLVGSVLGFLGIVMSWYGVNFVLGAGLHAYAFGDGGQPYVFSVAGLNIAYVALVCYVRSLRMARLAMPQTFTVGDGSPDAKASQGLSGDAI